MVNTSRNVLGQELQICCTSPMTGYFRNGKCEISAQDYGVHAVCAHLTKEFLEFTKAQGNDLSTPLPAYGFPGLKKGDRWCLCAARWKEALDAGYAPPIVLESTHEAVLSYVPLEVLQEHSIVKDQGNGSR
ncbi:conserved hypothetical protein [Hyella patelloides LEGE 07179]|uniref:DUF2237 domain-containing protein n=1 Tax=Hyella patelloides LEGE 07179 TaxID=945734 RepID=A0A563VM08_9CYAN|nr:DUF2237 domain-containing protein [Hyella patelloides]VEP12494.1 conserved hypothetical protein [Hyella patelloides LEGE 07179]